MYYHTNSSGFACLLVGFDSKFYGLCGVVYVDFAVVVVIIIVVVVVAVAVVVTGVGVGDDVSLAVVVIGGGGDGGDLDGVVVIVALVGGGAVPPASPSLLPLTYCGVGPAADFYTLYVRGARVGRVPLFKSDCY